MKGSVGRELAEQVVGRDKTNLAQVTTSDSGRGRGRPGM